jgi:ATP-dependent DNA helicase PIF1
MEDVYLYDFAEYKKSGVDDDGNPVYSMLTKPILPYHRMFDPSKENERENYFYSLLLLFVPFRNQADLIEEGETAETAFNRHMAENDSLNTHSEKLQRMLKARESVKKIDEARQAQEEDVTDSKPLEDDDEDGPQVAGETTSAMQDVLDLQQNESDGPSLEELVLSLNADQSRVYKQVKAHLEHHVLHECGWCQCKDLKPLHMFVSGVGGTGKSFLIKTVRALVGTA